jgi:excisionase family DNA binding protein
VVVKTKTMKSVQLIQITPEQFKDLIVDEFKVQLNDLKNNFSPKEPTELLTRSETAELLKIDLSTLWNWTKSGKLSSYGMGNRVYYKRSEIEAKLILIQNKFS